MSIVNELLARDLLFGTLAMEAEKCYEENKGMAALAYLFILAEHAVKLAINKADGNFRECLEDVKAKKLISEKDFLLLDHLRVIRNKFFHESHYATFWEEGGVSYPFSEDATRLHMYEIYSEKCFKIVLRLISQKP